MICPHCQNIYRTRYRGHIARCPSNPVMFPRYRAALEAPDRPGFLIRRADYEAKRPPELFTFGGLQTWAHGAWAVVGEKFGLTIQPATMAAARAGQTRRNNRVTDRIGAEIDAERDEHLAILEANRDVGLPVSRVYTDLRTRRIVCVIR